MKMKFFLIASFAFAAVVSGAYLPDVNNYEIVIDKLAQNEIEISSQSVIGKLIEYLLGKLALHEIEKLAKNVITKLIQNVIDKMFRQALEVVRKMLKDHEPFQIPDFPAQHIVNKDIDLNVDLKEVKVSKADDFTVGHIENNLPGSWAKFGVTVPKMHLEGQYKLNGVVQQRKVSGAGTFAVDFDSLVQTGTIQMAMTNHTLQMKHVDLDFDLKGLKFDLSDLSIEGMTKEQVEELLNSKFLEYLQTNKKEVCEVVARQVVKAANQIMAGKTLKELLDWLKKFIHQ